MRSRLFAFALMMTVGCGAAKTDDSPPASDGGSDTGAEAMSPETSTTDSGESAEISFDVSGDVAPPPMAAAVYAHSADTLYKLDPKTLAVTSLGAFGGISGEQMTDIALDQDGAMYGVTFTGVYAIDYKAGSPSCKRLGTLSTSFNGLTFAPKGTLDKDKEVLIGIANDGGWWRIDVMGGSATLTQLGSYGGGWTSSGDAVGILGDAVYATVTRIGNDHVVVIDPKTGAVTKDLGDTGVSGFWGVGYWGGVMYGFASSGSLYTIDLKTAKATEIPLPSKPPGGWWGAGVTTHAPTVIK